MARKKQSRSTRGIFVALAAMAFVVMPSIAEPAFGAELEVRITGMKKLRGLVHFGLFGNAEDFPGGDSVVGSNAPANQEIVVFKVPDLTPGQYAVAAYHDANANGEHDVSLFGIEDFAFSQDAKALFRAPKFEAAAFTVAEPATVVIITFNK